MYIAPAARRFVVSYIDAVLEHHNTPTYFRARENFIRLWKDSRYDFFTFGSGQKKLLKTHMKHLSTTWNQELDRIKALLGADEYERRVAKFVGTIIPGQADHRAQAKMPVRNPEICVAIPIKHDILFENLCAKTSMDELY
jgi:hypothetical protein